MVTQHTEMSVLKSLSVLHRSEAEETVCFFLFWLPQFTFSLGESVPFNSQHRICTLLLSTAQYFSPVISRVTRAPWRKFGLRKREQNRGPLALLILIFYKRELKGVRLVPYLPFLRTAWAFPLPIASFL
jgi:hypothetical protein